VNQRSSEGFANEPAVTHPPTTADVAPPAAATDLTPQIRIGGLKIPTDTLRAYTMVFVLIGIWIIFTWATNGIFLEARNFSNLIRQTAVTGVLAVGMLMVIVTGQIDLSVGAVVGLTGGISAIMLTWFGWGVGPALLAAVILGLIIGAAHGALVVYVNVPAFIVTLGGLLVWRGVIKGISQGNTIPISSQSFKDIGQSYVAPVVGYAIMVLVVAAIMWLNLRRVRARQHYGLAQQSRMKTLALIAIPSLVVIAFIIILNNYQGVPIPVLILLAVALCGAFLMQNTTFGRYLYAIGGNPEAAHLSGINLRRHILAVFCLMGALAGVAGVIYTARVGSGSPDAGVLLELDAIAACVIGGASLMGGRGTIFGACLGALFMASLNNGMSLKNVPDFTQDIVRGSILVTAVGLDMLGRRRL
jgi:D-xylose transport system permease protein